MSHSIEMTCQSCGRDIEHNQDCDSDDCPSLELIITPIGIINRGQDGSDQYVLITNNADTLTPEQAHSYLLPRVRSECTRPGGYFCTTVMAVQAQYSDNQVICTIQHRYDN